MSNCSSAASAMARSSSGQRPNRARGRETLFSRPVSTLVSTSSRPARLKCWNTMAQRARQSRSARPCSPLTTWPFQRMRPPLGVSSPLIIRSSVDLPAPERPITPTKLPGRISSDSVSTAVFAPYRRDNPSMVSICGPVLPCRLGRVAQAGDAAVSKR